MKPLEIPTRVSKSGGPSLFSGDKEKEGLDFRISGTDEVIRSETHKLSRKGLSGSDLIPEDEGTLKI
jgi:hypothetical protein